MDTNAIPFPPSKGATLKHYGRVFGPIVKVQSDKIISIIEVIPGNWEVTVDPRFPFKRPAGDLLGFVSVIGTGGGPVLVPEWLQVTDTLLYLFLRDATTGLAQTGEISFGIFEPLDPEILV